jgi:hypothetical protein
MFDFFKKKKNKTSTFNVNDNSIEESTQKLIFTKKFPFIQKQPITNAQINWRVYLEQQKNKELEEAKQYNINEVRRIHGVISNERVNIKKNKIYPL